MKDKINRVFERHPNLEKVLQVGGYVLLPHMSDTAHKLARKMNTKVKVIERPAQSTSTQKSQKKETDAQ